MTLVDILTQHLPVDDTILALKLALVPEDISALIPIAPHEVLTEWAADCAERVLPLFERERPDDSRPRLAIEAARKRSKNVNAAYSAAAHAAASASDAAYSAALVADSSAAHAAAHAASSAAYSAANAANAPAARGAAARAANAATNAASSANAAANDLTARAEERTWQYRRLVQLLTEVTT